MPFSLATITEKLPRFTREPADEHGDGMVIRLSASRDHRTMMLSCLDSCIIPLPLLALPTVAAKSRNSPEAL